MSDSLQLSGLQHERFPLSFPFPRAGSKSRPLSQWCHSNCFLLCCPLPLLSSICPSIRVFYNESALSFRWPKYGSFSFSISPSNEYSGLISFRIDWFDLLAVQQPLKSLLQHHSSKASFFFHDQPYLWSKLENLLDRGAWRATVYEIVWVGHNLTTKPLFMVQISHPFMTTRKTIVWLDGPLSPKWYLCFLIYCLGWSYHSFSSKEQVSWFHSCSHHL